MNRTRPVCITSLLRNDRLYSNRKIVKCTELRFRVHVPAYANNYSALMVVATVQQYKPPSSIADDMGCRKMTVRCHAYLVVEHIFTLKKTRIYPLQLMKQP